MTTSPSFLSCFFLLALGHILFLTQTHLKKPKAHPALDTLLWSQPKPNIGKPVVLVQTGYVIYTLDRSHRLRMEAIVALLNRYYGPTSTPIDS